MEMSLTKKDLKIMKVLMPITKKFYLWYKHAGLIDRVR